MSIDRVLECTFPFKTMPSSLWLGDNYLVMELIALGLEITLLDLSIKALRSFGEQIREEGRRSKENHRASERAACRLQATLRKEENREVERVGNLSREALLPTHIALHSAV